MAPNSPSITHPEPNAQARTRWLLLLASVLLATAAYPPLDLGWLAWVALVPFLYALQGSRTVVRALGFGWTFGVLHWGWTITWIGNTIVGWANTPWGWAAWIGLAMIKAGWYGLFAALAWAIARRSRGLLRIAATAGAWTAIEWLRGQGSLAMPWSLLGHTQYRYLPVIQIADMLGVYGITYAIAWANVTLAAALGRAGTPTPPEAALGRAGTPTPPGASRRTGWLRVAAVAATPGLLILVYGFAVQGRAYDGPAYRVTAMQPNIASYPRTKPDPARDVQALDAVWTEARRDRASLVVWPESIAPESVDEDTDTRRAFERMAREGACFHLVGSNRTDASDHDYNSALMLSPAGSLGQIYDKRWLVPFGEWIPGRSWLPFGDTFRFYERDTLPGGPEPPLDAGPARVGVLICFESVFPILSRDHVKRGANLLASITNDSWSGPSKVLRQHMAMNVLRSVEARRWMAMSGTTGITGFVAPTGRTVEAEPYRPAHLTATVHLLDGQTLYVRCGDWFVLVCACCMVAGLVRRRFDAPTVGEVQ